MKDGKSIEEIVESFDASKYCDSFSNAMASHLGSKENAKNICELFTKLCNHFPNCKKQEQDTSYKQNCGLLNYWLNIKLNEDKINGNTCVSYFENSIQSQCVDIFGYSANSLDYLFDIEKDELNKMNILYSLYEKYSKLDAIKYDNVDQAKQSLSTLSTACCPDYIKVSYMCNEDNKKNNRKFCDKLNAFKSKHDALYEKVAAKGDEYSDYFIKLSDCPNNKIISTAVTGSIIGLIPLLGVLYKVSELNIKI
ncbi:hypothetical protein PVBG_05632 [Plasmodium vivax Brazil I]|uniref:Variable surface protein Vir7-like protein n=1 Tax=Plasmodium vivax (strain Brazil I) TaxID=1033975 RepID=A0A0J9T1G6_PLAV1|nr:hypothetical protein PVBG_05632 [Plasmodium vivax Brazil I]